jgi:hypothetical protein
MTSKHPRLLASLFCVGVGCWTTGCGLFEQRAPASAHETESAKHGARPASTPSRKVAAPTPARQLGDFFVHRFSGSFAPLPLTLTEEVVGKEADAWVVDFSLAEGESVQRLRVRFDVVTGEPLKASHVEGLNEEPAKLADYEAMLARTVYAADVNDGLLTSSNATCLVGADELDCETKTYQVWIGDSAAKLSVVHSPRFVDRDVSGEIVAADGKVIYRAELVEAASAPPKSGVALK